MCISISSIAGMKSFFSLGISVQFRFHFGMSISVVVFASAAAQRANGNRKRKWKRQWLHSTVYRAENRKQTADNWELSAVKCLFSALSVDARVSSSDCWDQDRVWGSHSEQYSGPGGTEEAASRRGVSLAGGWAG